MRLQNLFILFIVTILIAGCGNSKKKKDFAMNNVAYPVGMDEHAAMVKYLSDLKTQYFDNPANRFASSVRAQIFLSQAIPEKTEARIAYYHQTAMEFLAAGESKKAIELLETGFSEINASGVSQELHSKVKALLAISYLRYGEQLNCISNHVAESCILPIAQAAIYTEKDATVKAFNLYKEIIKENPEDYNAVFLLHVAAMNLGIYPDSIPQEILIAPERFNSEYDIPRFENIANGLGLDVISASGGVCTEDFNNDGFVDVISSSWLLTDQIRFFVNNGDGTFTDKTEEANLMGITGGLNVQHADYNNDGFKDILILRGAWWDDFGKIPNSLLKNNGDGTFTDVTKSSGFFSLYPTQTAVFADFNNDGWLDIFVGNETRRNSEKYPCELFISNGDGTFTNKAKEAGIELFVFAKGVTAGDFDNDGYADIAISSQGQPNLLFKNLTGENNGIVKFVDVSKKAGINGPDKSFPLTFMDYNNDGWEDLFIFTYDAENCDYDNGASFLGKSVRGEYSTVYQNNGDGTFKDITSTAGMQYPMTSMGLNYGDIDNDGWLDIYVGTGTPEYTSLVPNKMFRNNNGEKFQDVTTSGGFGHLQKGHGIGFADFDNDGDQDIYADMGGGYEGDPFQGAFFENPGTANKWTVLKLQGVTCNRDAIGARVKLVVQMESGNKENFYHTVRTGASFGSNSLQLECGLGKAAAIESVEVRWPGGDIQTWNQVPLASSVLLVQGQKEFTANAIQSFQLIKSMEMNHSDLMHSMQH